MAQKKYYDTPFGEYMRELDRIEKDVRDNREYGSMLILTLIEEVGEMARAYLAQHGRKGTNIAAQRDETYQQELGDLMLAILRFARIKKIDLNACVRGSLAKIKSRRTKPKR